MVFCDYTQVGPKDDVIVESTTKFLYDFIDGKEAALKQLNGDITIGMGSALYRRTIVTENNLLFDTNRKYAEDVVFTVKALIKMKKIISVNKALMFYVRWDASVTNRVSLKHLDCYYSYVDLLEYIKLQGNFEEIEKFLIEFKIPYAIAHIFSVLSREEKFKNDLFNFLGEKDVKLALKNYKMQSLNKNNIRYFIQCNGILYTPNILLRIFKTIK